MSPEIPDMVTPIEIVTSVKGSEIRAQLAGRTIISAVWAGGFHDPRERQAQVHAAALDALAEAVKHADNPELWEHIRQRRRTS
ncbi:MULTISPECIES: hypothetical protein [unclassified Micromonospora]|uniref:hypothetical protein n=1 Tax=unclassified Micromonospora TaxID=2617518 RepID=UPI001B39C6C4|nr:MULTISPECIES: hypothetical protein [unclassified Micromonospora]MBQ1044406.1 hypothetical protein [Micromonospora sp. C72]MBQ1056911.1 hypothetical protein [Micromonospora sp. C32]